MTHLHKYPLTKLLRVVLFAMMYSTKYKSYSLKLENYMILFVCTVISNVHSQTAANVSTRSARIQQKYNIPLAGNRPVYELIDWEVVTPQWLKSDLFEVINETDIRNNKIRFPPIERRHGFTHANQEPIVLSTRDLQLVPSAAKLLQANKALQSIIKRPNYQPLISAGIHARHKFAESLHIRWKHIGASDETLTAFLFIPSGWPLTLAVMFIFAILLVPILGALLVRLGFKLAAFYKSFLWGPLKEFLRWMLINQQLSVKRWEKYIAPPYFLEPRTSWKLPFFLRNDSLEDIPYQLAYKPPINKIDYTNYILTEEDYDEMDLGMDEMEFIDDILQFRDQNPKVVARLLKHRLGVEKFYNYFDEDILSDESDVQEEEQESPRPSMAEDGLATEDDEQSLKNKYEYLGLLEIDEPWMHDEYDNNFTGSVYQLEEIQKRRQVLQKLKEEIKYYHTLIVKNNLFDENYKDMSAEEKKKAMKKAHKVMDKFMRYSKITKGRIAEIEPSSKKQASRNVALSKYLPLIDQMSHYNHRLNLKHAKQMDSERRKLQLNIFGGP